MATQNPEFEDLVNQAAKDWFFEHESDLSEHPEMEKLIAFQEGGLGEKERALLRLHLLQCPDCAEELKALEAFDAAPEQQIATGRPMADERVLSESWREFERSRSSRAGSRVWYRSAPRPLEWMAAGFVLVGVLALGFWLGQTVPAEDAAAVDTAYVLELLPDPGSEKRDFLRLREGGSEKQLPSSTETLVLYLATGNQDSGDRFELTLRDSGGRVVRRSRGVRGQGGRFAFVVPRRHVPDGEYQLVLESMSQGESSQIAVYSFRLLTGSDDGG